MRNEAAALEAARAQLAQAPDDPGALACFVEAAKAADRRDEAVSVLRAAYARRPGPELYAQLRRICTFPEFQLVPPPPGMEAADAARVSVGSPARDVIPRRPYGRMLDDIALYPVRDSTGLTILLASVACLTVASYISSLLVLVLEMFLVGYYWNVLASSGVGERHNPGWPDGLDFWEVFRVYLRWALATLVCFLPAYVFFIMAATALAGPNAAVPWALVGAGLAGLVFGALYYPMAMMMVGFGHSWLEVFNLRVAIPSIARIFGDYLLCAAAVAGSWILHTVIRAGVRWVAKGVLPVEIAAVAVGYVLVIYLFTMQMRAIGLLYYAREHDLGWFENPRT